MISEKKRLVIANIIYANVSSNFALFCNPEMRGSNFDWSKFSDMMVRNVEGWLWLQDYKLRSDKVVGLSRQYAREIADRMVCNSGFIKS